MTSNDKNQDKTQSEAPLKHRWGARFKSSREALHLTEKDVALRLHLKPHLIEIIEAERFESGPPPIFMRGYIRSYGRLLNLSEKEITQALAQLNLENPAAASPSAVMRSHIQAQQNSHSGWSTILVVIVLVGLVGMWWNNHSRNTLKESTEVALMQPAQPTVPMASNTTAPTSNPATPQAPADPMPNELAAMMPAATSTPNTPPAQPAAAMNVVAHQPRPASASMANTATPAATTVPDKAPENAEASATRPAVTDTPNATTEADNADTTVDTDKPAQAVAENSDDEAKAEKPRTRIARAHNDVTSEDMEVPEQGLDTEDNNN